MKKGFILVLVCVLLFSIMTGCSTKREYATSMSTVPSAEISYGANGLANTSYTMDKTVVSQTAQEMSKEKGNSNLTINDRKIIKNGDITISIKDSEEAQSQIAVLLKKHNGYVQSSNERMSGDSFYTDISVKVPFNNFDAFFNELKKIGKVTHNGINTQDVTEEYVDLTARQKTLELQESRLQEMISKANNVDELLRIENELSRVRYEIERVTGRVKYLDNMTSLSTITINLQKNVTPTEPPVDNIGEQILFSLSDGFGTFVSVFTGLIKIIAWLLPFLVILVPVGIFTYKKIKKIK